MAGPFPAGQLPSPFLQQGAAGSNSVLRFGFGADVTSNHLTGMRSEDFDELFNSIPGNQTSLQELMRFPGTQADNSPTALTPAHLTSPPSAPAAAAGGKHGPLNRSASIRQLQLFSDEAAAATDAVGLPLVPEFRHSHSPVGHNSKEEGEEKENLPSGKQLARQLRLGTAFGDVLQAAISNLHATVPRSTSPALGGSQMEQALPGMTASAVSTGALMPAMGLTKQHAHACQHGPRRLQVQPRLSALGSSSTFKSPAASGLLLPSHQTAVLPGTSQLLSSKAAPSASAQSARAAASGAGSGMTGQSADLADLLESIPDDGWENTMLGEQRPGSIIQPTKQDKQRVYPWQTAAFNSSGATTATLPLRLPPHQKRAILAGKARQLNPDASFTSAAKRPKAVPSGGQSAACLSGQYGSFEKGNVLQGEGAAADTNPPEHMRTSMQNAQQVAPVFAQKTRPQFSSLGQLQQQHTTVGRTATASLSSNPTSSALFADGAATRCPTTSLQLPHFGPGIGTATAFGGSAAPFLGLIFPSQAIQLQMTAQGMNTNRSDLQQQQCQRYPGQAQNFVAQQMAGVNAALAAAGAALSGSGGSTVVQNAAAGQSQVMPSLAISDARVPARILEQCPGFDDLLALNHNSVGPLQHCQQARPFTASVARDLVQVAQQNAAEGLGAAGHGQQQAAGVGRVAEQVKTIRAFFWSVHALLKLRAEQGFTVALDDRSPAARADEYVGGMVSTAHMLSGIWAWLQSPAIAALSASEGIGLVPPAGDAAVPVPTPAPAGVTPAQQDVSEAMQRVMRNFQQLLASNQPLPIAPDGHPSAGQVILETAATIQHLVQLCCPPVLQLIAMTREGADAQQMQPHAIQPNGTPLPPHIRLARTQEIVEMLTNMARHPEAHALLRTVSGLQESVSALGPASVRKQLMKAAETAMAEGTGLQGWFWRAQELFLHYTVWGAPACCKESKAHTAAGDALEKCVQHRVRFACLLVAARNLLCMDQPPWLL